MLEQLEVPRTEDNHGESDEHLYHHNPRRHVLVLPRMRRTDIHIRRGERVRAADRARPHDTFDARQTQHTGAPSRVIGALEGHETGGARRPRMRSSRTDLERVATGPKVPAAIFAHGFMI